METIGRYEIVEELGKGAMGLVYKAVDPNIGRTVALKTMRLDVHGLEHKEMLGRFKNEARAAGTLNHPNIVTIYDAGEDKGVFYIAMEFIEGESLQHILNANRVIPPEKIISITRQVCAGLDYAHQHGVIHRDVKPANIMITADGTAKIMDFGIAKAGGGLTSTGQVLGTPNYMAPEQIKGKPLDGRSDLFSVGVMLYEMLTGEKPFVGQNVTTIIYKIVNENPIPPRELDVSIHPGLNAVVNKALSKAPEDRYQRGAELAHDLESYKSFGSDASSTQMMATAVMQGMGDQTLVASGPIAAAPVAVPDRVSQTQVGAAVASQQMAAQESAKIQAVQTAPPAPLKKSRWPLYGAIIAIIVVGVSYTGLHKSRQAKVEELGNPDVQKQLEEARQAMDQGLQMAQQVANIGKPSATQPEVPAIAMPPSGFAEMTINSDPAGATVQVDGQPQPGVTPLVLAQLMPGKHTITVTLDGFAPATKNIDLTAGKKKDVSLQLKAEMGVINVTSTPKDVEIAIDGKPYGKAPAHLKVPVGEHTVTFAKDGYQKQEEKITVTTAQPVNIVRELPATGVATTSGGADVAAPFKKLKKFFGGAKGEERGTLAITTKPAGAQVLINGSPALGTTPVRTQVPAGKYKMEIKLDGHKAVEREIVVEKDKVTGIDEILLPK